jgi:hypothetical protein
MNVYRVSDGVFTGEYTANTEDEATTRFVLEYYGFKPRNRTIGVVQITTFPIEV